MVNGLSQNAYQLLDTGAFEEAEQRFDAMILADKTDCSGYIGKLCAKVHARTEAELWDRPLLYDRLPDRFPEYSLAVQYIDAKKRIEWEHFLQRNRNACKRRYEEAESLLVADKYKEARDLFRILDTDAHWEDAKLRCNQVYPDALRQYGWKTTLSEIGETYLTLCGYTWQVLSIETNRILLITQDPIKAEPYDKVNSVATWETGTIRKWLNERFLASLPREFQDRVLSTSLPNPDNPKFGTDGGNETVDKVFLLSFVDIEYYFHCDEARSSSAWWWLRTPGIKNSRAAFIFEDGSYYFMGLYVFYEQCTLRPALWLSLEPADLEQLATVSVKEPFSWRKDRQKEWAENHLCMYCGGALNFFLGRCWHCGRYTGRFGDSKLLQKLDPLIRKLFPSMLDYEKTLPKTQLDTLKKSRER